jgi:hypothetical protein
MYYINLIYTPLNNATVANIYPTGFSTNLPNTFTLALSPNSNGGATANVLTLSNSVVSLAGVSNYYKALPTFALVTNAIGGATTKLVDWESAPLMTAWSPTALKLQNCNATSPNVLYMNTQYGSGMASGSLITNTNGGDGLPHTLVRVNLMFDPSIL